MRARLLLLVLLAVVPALGMIVYDGLQERRAAGARARQVALELARGAARDQERLTVETRQLLAVLPRLPQLRSEPDECDDFLRQLLAEGSPYANIGVVRPDGRLTCGALPFDPGLSLADRPWFRRTMETGRFSVGEYQIGRITGLATINFASPIFGPGRRLEGVVYAALPLTWLQQRIAEANLPQGYAVTVVDSSLTVLARYPTGAGWVGRPIGNSPLGMALRRTRTDTTEVLEGLDGVARLYGIVPLRHLPGGSAALLAVGIPTSEAYALAERGLARNLGALTLLTLVILGAAWRGSDLFVLRHVRALVRATRQLGEGELGTRAPVPTGGGEIAELAQSFNEMADRLHYVANYDPVTELPNRTLCDDRLTQALARARQDDCHVAVVSVVVDRLAELHATLGQPVSDQLLRLVAGYLAGAVREGDTVARAGGDEFVIVLADLSDLHAVETVTTEILSRAPQAITVDGQEIFLTLAAGAAIYPTDSDVGAALVRSAALARQTSGRSGANIVSFYSADINARVQARHTIERELRHAVERNELLLYYQPVVDVPTRHVVGVEALIRWHSEKLGHLSPVQFIPVAEESGLITPIGEWIVRTALEQGKRWHAKGFDIRINVNVSVDQLRQPGFVDRLVALLAASDFDPWSLALGIEITESELMENVEEAVAAMLRFREMGMKVYIDDFGTGYSSLSYLRQLPIDTLKVDASFIRDIPDNADAVAVVKAILAMAQGLELRVIAEGVETEAQFAMLRDHGCDAVQGYLFSKPAPAEEIETLFGRQLDPEIAKSQK